MPRAADRASSGLILTRTAGAPSQAASDDVAQLVETVTYRSVPRRTRAYRPQYLNEFVMNADRASFCSTT
jgi:hypothetical protein